MLAIGANEADFPGPDLFVNSMVFSGDENFPYISLLQPPGEAAPGGDAQNHITDDLFRQQRNG
jgi:hypothetical protein